MSDYSKIRDWLSNLDFPLLLFIVEHILGACLLFLLFITFVEIGRHVGYWNSGEELNRYLQDWIDIGVDV